MPSTQSILALPAILDALIQAATWRQVAPPGRIAPHCRTVHLENMNFFIKTVRLTSEIAAQNKLTFRLDCWALCGGEFVWQQPVLQQRLCAAGIESK